MLAAVPCILEVCYSFKRLPGVQEKWDMEKHSTRLCSYSNLLRVLNIINGSEKCFEDLSITFSVCCIVYSSSDCNVPHVETFMQLVDLFRQMADDLCSDGTIVHSVTICVSTTTRGTLKSENVIKLLE